MTLATISDVKRLEELILQAPQVDLLTTHNLENGMYARTIYLQPGTVLTGAVHKTDHINIVFGDITVTTDEGVQRITGYHVINTKAGSKRAGFAHAATAWTTICKTTKTSLEEIEDELVEDAGMLQTRQPAIASNHVKQLEA